MQFDFLPTPQIIFGTGVFRERLLPIVKSLGSKVLFVTSPSVFLLKDVQEVLSTCSDHNLTIFNFPVKSEPTIDLVDRGVEKGLSCKVEVVVGIGGGSTIDAGKAIAGLITNGNSARDYMEVIGKSLKVNKPSLPFVAVPTTAGTGAEVTKNAVLTSEADGFKASIRSLYFIPKIALVDPSLTISVPSDVTARCGMDALTQLLEAYTSNKAQSLTDSWAELGLRKVVLSLRMAYKNGRNVTAREELSFAALLSGLCLANAGLGAVHGFASPLGGMFPAPHGTICAKLLAPIVEVNIRELSTKDPNHPILRKYARVAGWFTGKTFRSLTVAHKALVELLYELTRELGIPPLSKYGITRDSIPTVVSKASKSSSMKYNPIRLNEKILEEVLTKVL